MRTTELLSPNNMRPVMSQCMCVLAEMFGPISCPIQLEIHCTYQFILYIFISFHGDIQSLAYLSCSSQFFRFSCLYNLMQLFNLLI